MDGRITIASVSGRRILDVLADMGMRTVLLDDDIPFDVALQVDVPIETDLDAWRATEAKLRAVHRRRPIDAVVSVRDSHVPLAGYLAARLGVRGPALPAALICYDKARMRAALHAADLPNPRFAVAREPGEVALLADRVGFPLVLKPTHSAGGASVRLCRDHHELGAATTELTKDRDLVELLLEEYLDGPEYAIQTVTTDGDTEVLSILRTYIGPPPRFAEIGYDYPSGLTADEEGTLAHFMASVLRAIGFGSGIAHSQVRLTANGPRVVEINPRPPGGMLAQVTQTVSGVDMVRAAIEATMGTPITRSAATARQVLYRCLVFETSGYLDYDTSALTESPSAVVEVDVDPGDAVYSVEHPDGGVYGRIVLFGSDGADLHAQYRDIRERLAVRVREGR